MEELLGKIFLLPSHNQNTLIQPNVKGIVFQNLGLLNRLYDLPVSSLSDLKYIFGE